MSWMYSRCETSPVYIVHLVYLVDLVHLVSFVQPKNQTNQIDQTDHMNKTRCGLFSSLTDHVEK